MRLARLTVGALVVAMIALSTSTPTRSYSLFGPKWANGNIVMQLQLGSSGTLSDGATSWGASAESAMAIWNTYLNNAQFTVVRD